MHNKSVIVAVSFLLSVGGWFLLNIIFSVSYSKNVIYDVKGGFLSRFGRNALWWLTLIVVIFSCVIFEMIIASLKTAFRPTDVRYSSAVVPLLLLTISGGRCLPRIRARR